MVKPEVKTAVLADGLRYKSKPSGSPFKAGASLGSATMSCFLCGKHRTRSLMKTRNVLGKAQAVCAPNCKAMDEMLAAGRTTPLPVAPAIAPVVTPAVTPAAPVVPPAA